MLETQTSWPSRRQGWRQSHLKHVPGQDRQPQAEPKLVSWTQGLGVGEGPRCVWPRPLRVVSVLKAWQM